MTDQPAPEQQGDNVYEMLWDCEFCGTSKLLGKTHRFCPSCGAAQNPDWRYFPSDEEKVAVKDHVYYGADKICPACGTAQSASAEYCGRCGSPLEGAVTAKIHEGRIKAEGESIETEDLYARQTRERDAAVGRGLQQESSTKRRRWWIYALAGFVIVAVVLIVVMLFWKKETTMTVSGHRWETELEIEELRAIDESKRGECVSLPDGAYDPDPQWEQVDTERVKVDETCRIEQRDRGDGTFREVEVCDPVYENRPVYGWVCHYRVNRWQQSRSAQAEGGINDPVVSPVPNLSRTGECVGCERTGDYRERFLIILTDGQGETHDCPLEQDQWRSTLLGTTFTVKIGVVTGSVDCGSMQPNE